MSNKKWKMGQIFVNFSEDPNYRFIISLISKLFYWWKLTSIRLIWRPAKLIESYEKMSLGGDKADHFSCFHSSGLRYGYLRDKEPIWANVVFAIVVRSFMWHTLSWKNKETKASTFCSWTFSWFFNIFSLKTSMNVIFRSI